MNKVQLLHPENKNAIRMDSAKYDMLKDAVLRCLKKLEQASFSELLAAVGQDLKMQRKKIEGKLEWNLFWVTLDLEARASILRDKKTSPFLYSLS